MTGEPQPAAADDGGVPSAPGWRPTLGAVVGSDGTSFRVWAPGTARVELVLRQGTATSSHHLAAETDGFHSIRIPGIGSGARYGYRLDGDGPFPDPASREQPDGVHGLSSVVAPGAYAWSDAGWAGVPLASAVIYELHVGTFTPEGTFAAAAARLPALRRLGVTVVELMPVADFPGTRNWGYDGVSLFAPARCYGRPDDLRAFVDAAHALGLAVLLDVVYNHAGPDGAYFARFSPHCFTTRHQNPWGAGLDLDGPHSRHLRAFFIENALHWLHEYHVDGLRLDATHAIHDDSPTHFVQELAAVAHGARPAGRVLVIAEDHRNVARMIVPVAEGGWGLDAVWADDLHHEVRRLLAGDHEGYYADYAGDVADVAATIRRGWFFTGQYSSHLRQPRGTDPTGLPPQRFVVCLQNHDQVGNRAFGERLHHQIGGAAFRAASVLLLLGPQTPLLFMGQEWGATSPFLYFTDHSEALGRLVTEGRRREFGAFAAFADEERRARIPDPQAASTFGASRLDWDERTSEPHAGLLRLHEAVLRLRHDLLLPADTADAATARTVGTDTIVLDRRCRTGERARLVVRLRGAGPVALARTAEDGGERWRCVLTSEDMTFAGPAHRPALREQADALVVEFAGPAAVLLTAASPWKAD